MTQVNLNIDGMSCGSCVGRVDKALTAFDGASNVSVNLAAETAAFDVKDASVLRKVTDKLQGLGYPARSATTTLSVQSMSCASCVARVEAALEAVTGVVSVSVNLAAESAYVEYLEGTHAPNHLVAALNAAGYTAQAQTSKPGQTGPDRKKEEADTLRNNVVLAGILTLPVFLLEMGSHLVPAIHMTIENTIGLQWSWGIQCLLTTIVLIGPGRQFYTRGIPALLRGAPDMNSLVAVGTGAAWSYSVIATFFSSLLPDNVRAVYFEAAAVIVVLILIGRWLEARAKGRTGAAIQALVGLQARTTRVLRDGTAVEVDVDTVLPGELVLLRPGERVPVDGTITDGNSYVDESMITGEPVPVAKALGDPITAGTVNGTGALTFCAERVGADTTLAQIIKMVEDAQGAKLPIQGLVNRVTLWFVPAVMALSAITVATWLVFGPDPALTLALVAGVSVLIIACPCAMGLATPTSIMVGTGRAAEMGVLFRKGDALQELSKTGIIALDKTGTITQGKPTLHDVTCANGFDRRSLLGLIAAAEMASEHPIAQAIVRHAQDAGVVIPNASDFQSITGQGVVAWVEGQKVHVGADRFMRREGIDITAFRDAERTLASQGHTVLFAALDGQLAALLSVSDPIKPTSYAAVSALQARGFAVAMITGDKHQTAELIAREAGISHVVAEVLPEEKVQALNTLKQTHGKVAFVGDGINDAPALAQADVGIAIGTGTDVAIESADVVLMSGDLLGVVNAVEISQRTMANIKQNLGWAFGYNMALIPVAAGVLYPAFGLLLSPVFAAGAMALSSVSVLTNALRLRRISTAIEPRGEENALSQRRQGTA